MQSHMVLFRAAMTKTGESALSYSPRTASTTSAFSAKSMKTFVGALTIAFAVIATGAVSAHASPLHATAGLKCATSSVFQGD